jgi:PEP-CTERM motif-containing protein
MTNVAFKTALAALVLGFHAAHAEAVIMTFEGLQDFEYVQDYYAGGFGSKGSGPGANFGVVFSGSTYSSIDEDDGGTGNFGGEPSPGTAVSFQQGGAYMNVAGGFVGMLSFYYANPNGASSISIHSGENGTGELLATLSLPMTAFQGQADPTGNLSPLYYTSVNFSGVARSVDFIALAHRAYVDDITLSPVPEPGTWALATIGLLGMVGRRRWEQRRCGA